VTTQKAPLYNLKVVLKETGLKPDTLRAWERRYGLPSPHRSAGGHRLYSRRDINIVKWLTARQVEGLSIKRAVQLYRQLEEDGQDPLAAPEAMAPLPVPIAASGTVGASVSQLREEWISACLAYDERRSEQVLSEAFSLFPPETVCLGILREAVNQIGERWYLGRVTVQQEHFCSALALRRLDSLIMTSPAPTRPGRILAACPPKEVHVFGLLMLTFLLRRRGWEVIYLGANVPVERLETTVAATNPDLVIMAAQQLHSAATLLDSAQLLQREGRILAYGGLVFNVAPDLRGRIPGHYLGDNLESAARQVETLMMAPRQAPASEPASEVYRQALDYYVERKGLIEAEIGGLLNGAGLAANHLLIANQELSENIAAALTLGDMNYMGTDIQWVEGLLSHHGVPAGMLDDYLSAYHDAAKTRLDERGQPVIDWLASVLERENE
jgi:DNA-binding transcriptional MerR regulator